jgi:hypothetical protein
MTVGDFREERMPQHPSKFSKRLFMETLQRSSVAPFLLLSHHCNNHRLW